MENEAREESVAPVRRSIVIGQAAIALVGLYALTGSISLGLWTAMGPGAGFFPAVLGAILAILSVIWFIQERNNINSSASAEPLDKAQVWAVVLSLVILAAVMPLLGFQMSVFAFLLYHLQFRARIGWAKAVVISLFGSVGVFYLFTAVLHVSLPVASLLPLNLIGL